jgi:hypothetical protein
MAGASQRTARRRSADPVIVAAVQEVCGRLVESATGRLLAMMDDAVTALAELLISEIDAKGRLCRPGAGHQPGKRSDLCLRRPRPPRAHEPAQTVRGASCWTTQLVTMGLTS